MATPILLFPGIMGSRLYFNNADRFWDPDDTRRMLEWMPVWPFRSDDDNRQQLHAREPAGVVFDLDSGNGIDQDKSNRGWSTVVWSFYGKMLNALENQFGKGSTYGIGYDWRQDISALADYATQKIQATLAETGAAKVAIVTHSMGGLVIRAALRKALATGSSLLDQIAGIVHVCMPAAGAVIIYRRAFTGLTRPFDGGGGIGDRAFRLLLGNNRVGFLGNLSGLPGAAELVPSNFLAPVAGGQPWCPFLPQPLDIANMYLASGCPPGIVPSNLGLADQVLDDLHERVGDINAIQLMMGDPGDLLHPQTSHIYGIAHATEVQLNFNGNGVAIPAQDPNGGDGTVPLQSALSLGVTPGQAISVPTEHGAACEDSQVQQHVLQILGSLV